MSDTDLRMKTDTVHVSTGCQAETIWCETCDGEPCPDCGRAWNEYGPSDSTGCSSCDDGPCEDCIDRRNPKGRSRV